MRKSGTSASIDVCNGCCCGNIEKGHSEVPINAIKAAWKEYGLEKDVKLTITDCLGPCSMHNVTLLKTDEGQTWLGKLSEDEHYNSIVEWGRNVAKYGDKIKLPKNLAPHCFERDKI
tara:strand:+ start:475 stop:825 length:351 start_codon:yes stop_codon:yes gene_type:complete